MSVDIESNIVVYTFASSRTFTYVFRLLSEADLTVTRTTAAGVSTVLALTTNYSVTGVNSYYGGTVVITAGTTLVAGDKITIQRTIASYTQGVAFRNQGAYYAETVEAALDKLTMMCLEIKSNASRQPSYVLTTEATNYAFPAPVLGQSFRWARTSVYPITWYLEGHTPTLSTLAGQITTAQLPALIPSGNLPALSAHSGSITTTQLPALIPSGNLPALSAHSGSITTTQLPALIPSGNLPALSALSGAVSASQLPALPASTLTGTVPTATLPAFTGDATTTAGSSAVTVGKIQGKSVSSTAPGTGDILIWNGAAWAPGANLGAGGGTGTLAGDVTGSLNATVASASKLRSVNISATTPQHYQTLTYNEPGAQWEPSSYLTGMLNGNSNGSINIGEGALALETANAPAAFASQTNTYSGVNYTVDSSTVLSLTAFSGIVYQSAAGGLALNVSSTSGSTALVASYALPATLRVGQRVTHSGWTGNRYITGISGLNITISSSATVTTVGALTAFDDLSATDTIITTGSIDITASGLAKTFALNYLVGGTVNTHTFQVEGLTPGSTGTITLTSLNNNNIAIGHNAGNILTSGYGNVVVGHLADCNTAADTKSCAVGALSVASDSSCTIGYSAVSLTNAVSVGYLASTGANAIAIGSSSSASLSGTIAIGANAYIGGASSIAIGASSTVNGSNSVAIGRGTSATGLSSVAIGDAANSNGNSSTAIGCSANGTGAGTTAIGYGAGSNQPANILIGVSPAAGSGSTNIVIGNASGSSLSGSIAIGHNAYANGANQLVVGNSSGVSFGSSKEPLAEVYVAATTASPAFSLPIAIEYADSPFITSQENWVLSGTGIAANTLVAFSGFVADTTNNRIQLYFGSSTTASIPAGTKLTLTAPAANTYTCTTVIGSPVIYVTNPGAGIAEPINGLLVTGTGIPAGTKLVKTFHSEANRGGTNRYFLLSRPATAAGSVPVTFSYGLVRYSKSVTSMAANSTIVTLSDVTNLKVGDKLTSISEPTAAGTIGSYLRGSYIVAIIGTTQIVLSQATTNAAVAGTYMTFSPSGGMAIGNNCSPFSNEIGIAGHGHSIALTNATSATASGQSIPVTIMGRDYSIPLMNR